MGLAQISVDAVAGTGALADERWQATGGHSDADASGVGDAPARPLLSANGALGLGHAADRDGLPLPAVKPKDAIGFRDQLPTFEVVDLSAPLLPLADIRPIEGGSQRSHLLGGEAG
jgi:hypothetical protein